MIFNSLFYIFFIKKKIKMNNNNNSKIHKHLNYISKSHQKIYSKKQ